MAGGSVLMVMVAVAGITTSSPALGGEPPTQLEPSLQLPPVAVAVMVGGKGVISGA